MRKGFGREERRCMCEFYHSLVFYIAIKIFTGLRKSFEKLKYLLISNTDWMQISFTKANHETFIHFNFFPPWPFSLLRSVIFTFSINSKTWSHYILLNLKHPDRCCCGKQEKLLCDCLPVFSNQHRNLPFFCTDSWASIFLPKQLIKSIQLMEKQSYKQVFKNNLILWVILRFSPASLILPMSSTCSFATFKNQQRF